MYIDICNKEESIKDDKFTIIFDHLFRAYL